MINILESFDLQGFITGETPSPPEFIPNATSYPQPNPQYFEWHRSNKLVKGWITTTLSEEVLGIVVGLNSSQEVWNALVYSFAQVSSDRSLALKQRLTSITKGFDSLSEYLRKFKIICDELAVIGKPIFD